MREASRYRSHYGNTLWRVTFTIANGKKLQQPEQLLSVQSHQVENIINAGKHVHVCMSFFKKASVDLTCHLKVVYIHVVR